MEGLESYEWSGDRIPVGARFPIPDSAPRPTQPPVQAVARLCRGQDTEA